MKNTQNNIHKVLKNLNKTETELGNYCIEQVAGALEQNGYTDSVLWARNMLAAMIGDFRRIRDSSEIEELLMELEGAEHDAIEAVHSTLIDLEEKFKKEKPSDIKNALLYSVERTLDTLEKEKYQKLYR